mmetsp:Transcript_15379/g.40726  ORF Transcript_15379/g.40726 Transcript_15379/m.40726 type:complete len:247 (+) Transcript_15379:861-1601(+)
MFDWRARSAIDSARLCMFWLKMCAKPLVSRQNTLSDRCSWRMRPSAPSPSGLSSPIPVRFPSSSPKVVCKDASKASKASSSLAPTVAATSRCPKVSSLDSMLCTELRSTTPTVDQPWKIDCSWSSEFSRSTSLSCLLPLPPSCSRAAGSCPLPPGVPASPCLAPRRPSLSCVVRAMCSSSEAPTRARAKLIAVDSTSTCDSVTVAAARARRSSACRRCACRAAAPSVSRGSSSSIILGEMSPIVPP